MNATNTTVGSAAVVDVGRALDARQLPALDGCVRDLHGIAGGIAGGVGVRGGSPWPPPLGPHAEKMAFAL